MVALLVTVGFAVGCKQKTKMNTKEGKRRAAPAPRIVFEKTLKDLAQDQLSKTSLRKDWQKESWVDQILQKPKTIPVFLSQQPARRKVLAAMWENRWGDALEGIPADVQNKPGVRIVAARLYLRMARFYRASFRLSAGLNLGRLKKRLERAKKIKLGAYFSYHYGRQLCLSGFRKEAVSHLTKVANDAKHPRHGRAKAWLAVCRLGRGTVAEPKAFTGIDTKTDPEVATELLLLKHLYGARAPDATTNSKRFKWFLLALGKGKVDATAETIKGMGDEESIKEGEIEASLEYFDPLVLRTLQVVYAKKALDALANVPKADRFAPFYRGRAHHLLMQPAKATQAYTAFLGALPKEINWSYMMFSWRHSIAFLKAEATYHRARLMKRNHPAKAKQAFQALSREPYPASCLGYVGLLSATSKKEAKVRKRAYLFLLTGVLQAEALQKKLFVAYTKASSATAPKGATDADKTLWKQRAPAAGAILKWRLHRYVARSFLMWASEGALLYGDPSSAEGWMEQLHNKDKAYEIGGFNEPFQFILTTRVYINAGKMGIATMFLSKARKSLPALTQAWSLLRILRIYKGTSGGVLIVMPKGG